MNYLEEYDETDPISIETYAKRLIGKTFADVCRQDDITKAMVVRETTNYEVKHENKKRKGGLGELIEERFFHYQTNNDARPDFDNQLRVLNSLDDWWITSKNKRDLLYQDKKHMIINSYSKNYFSSYVLNEGEDNLEDEYTYAIFERFLNVFEGLGEELRLDSFKNDELFNKYLHKKSNKKLENPKIVLIAKEVDELKDYLNNHKISQYVYAKEIEKFLEIKGKNISYFRVIKRYWDSKKGYFPKEAFAFPNRTFSELYQNDIKKDAGFEGEKGYKNYDQSLFHTEIKKAYPVFVLDFEESTDSAKKIKSIEFIPEFSFAEKTEQAKIVYDKTVKAFERGNEDLFPKVSNENEFHIRPKAANANDTFEFTNGEQITKRTFWANRVTVNELIKESIDK